MNKGNQSHRLKKVECLIKPMHWFLNGLRCLEKMTEAEKVLCGYLKGGVDGLKFRRQHPVGIHIADFYCHKLKLIIELDGKVYERPEIKILDEHRENELREWGYEVIGFTNEELFQNIDKVLILIKLKVEELKPVRQSFGASSPPFREDLGGFL